MKTLLICPVHRPSVSRLAEHDPLVLAPILGKCLVEYWLEYLVARGDRDVRIIAPDRPDRVRATVGDGSRWGLRVEVLPHAGDAVAVTGRSSRNHHTEIDGISPDHLVIMDHLPGLVGFPLLESYASWFAALQAWIPEAHSPDRIGRRQIQPGVSVGLHARISRSARFHAPCWLGDHVVVGPKATIGPGTILEDRAFIGSGACITQSVIGPDTFVGQLTLVEQSLACGSLLINWKTRSCLDVPDAFILCALGAKPPARPQAFRLIRSPLLTLRNLIPGQQRGPSLHA